jgi:hypothetical protein
MNIYAYLLSGDDERAANMSKGRWGSVWLRRESKTKVKPKMTRAFAQRRNCLHFVLRSD